jgi:hypothetical protein
MEMRCRGLYFGYASAYLIQHPCKPLYPILGPSDSTSLHLSIIQWPSMNSRYSADVNHTGLAMLQKVGYYQILQSEKEQQR